MYGPTESYKPASSVAYYRGNLILEVRSKGGKVLEVIATQIYAYGEGRKPLGIHEHLLPTDTDHIFRLASRRSDATVPITDVVRRTNRFPNNCLVRLGGFDEHSADHSAYSEHTPVCGSY